MVEMVLVFKQVVVDLLLAAGQGHGGGSIAADEAAPTGHL